MASTLPHFLHCHFCPRSSDLCRRNIQTCFLKEFSAVFCIEIYVCDSNYVFNILLYLLLNNVILNANSMLIINKFRNNKHWFVLSKIFSYRSKINLFFLFNLWGASLRTESVCVYVCVNVSSKQFCSYKILQTISVDEMCLYLPR